MSTNLLIIVITILQTTVKSRPLNVPFSIVKPVIGTRAQVIIQPGEQIRQMAYFWKLVVFMDLEPYAIEKKNIQTIVGQVESLCQHSDFSIQDVCGKYLDEIFNLNSEIYELDQLFLADNVHEKPRPRRGLINAGGMIGKFLFGIMNADDHKVISSEISNLKDTQFEQKHLIAKTTSIVKSSLELFTSSIDKVNQNEEQLSLAIVNIQKQINQSILASTDVDFRVRINTNRINTFELLSRVSSSMKNFIVNQKELLQVIATLHHVPNLPVFIKPTTLIARLNEISNLLPKENTLPLAPVQNNLFWYYKKPTVDTKLEQNTLMLQMNIPITDSSVFSTFHLFSVPIPISGAIFEIIPLESKAIAVDSRLNDYLMISKTVLDHCMTLPDSSKLCPVLQVYNSQQHPSCEMQWITKKDHDNTIPELCPLKKVNISSVSIMETNKPNTWIYALPSLNTVTFIGPLGTQFQENLENSGELTLVPGTTAIIHGITIKAHPLLNSTSYNNWNQSVPIKMSPLKSLGNPPNSSPSVISHLPKLVPLWDANKVGKLDSEASELENQASKLHIQYLNQSMSTHTYIMYPLLALVLVAWGYVAIPPWVRVIKRLYARIRPEIVNTQPEPHPPQLNNNIQSEVFEPPCIPIQGTNLPSPYPRARYV